MQNGKAKTGAAFQRISSFIVNRPLPVLAVAAVVFLALGWGQDGINLDSTTYSVIARNMAEHGSWLTPTYTPYYHPHFAEHPPLVMWLQGIIFLLFGANDSTARLFGAVCTLGAVVFVYLLGKEIKGKHFGYLSAIILLLTYNFMHLGNSTLLDMPMTFFILVTLWGMTKLYQTEKRHQALSVFFITGIALGCSFLSKGVVSAPIWITFVVMAFIRRRKWRNEPRMWLIPATALGLIGAFLLLDYLYNDGHFTRYYFFTQIPQRFLHEGSRIHTEWYEFSYRFAKLYLPFILFVPFGFYLAFKEKTASLFPVLLTLFLYGIFYSSAAKLYYHYFVPAYALAAPFAALPVVRMLKETTLRKIEVWFFILWLTAAIGVTAAGIRIHEIRSPEIYSLQAPMNTLLDNSPHRNGLFIHLGEPQWDYIAKTNWYWRSDILEVGNVETAIDSLRSNPDFVYLMSATTDSLSDSLKAVFQLKTYTRNDKIVIYVPTR